MSFSCTQGMAKYLQQTHDVQASEVDHEDSTPIPNKLNLATVDTVDTLPGLNPLDTDLTRDISGDSISSAEAVQHAVALSIMDVAQVQEWCPHDYEMVKTLQLAPRNQGRVDLMKIVKTGKFAAVKRMPNSWITTGPKEFDSAYPESS